jgi:hypothetical protein
MGHPSDRGLSLLELLVSMFTVLIVASMAFHLLISSSRSVSQQLSMASRGDRLRLLQTLLERDMAARFPNPMAAPIEIGETTGSPTSRDLIASDVLLQPDTDSVDLGHVTYQLQTGISGGEEWDLVRTVEPLSVPEGIPAGTQTILFRLEPDEHLLLSATREVDTPTQTRTRLVWRFLDQRYHDHPVTREIVLVGGRMP